jgi:hypothetical protein
LVQPFEVAAEEIDLVVHTALEIIAELRVEMFERVTAHLGTVPHDSRDRLGSFGRHD